MLIKLESRKYQVGIKITTNQRVA